ncbi:hypothetical protein [Mucilaginibacter aquariorum]|uniref:Uncharacterized protein n=1 Tax=Mucilaginibacter aquariorum TaxID=2967225 RepID=A0ABT1T8W1_9SPHI|nr:hypothetical protein [Mucilaginibacter aquariorum]MCQ6960398.1 hypothetical protein [Mucilaginibacter aquariorum]
MPRVYFDTNIYSKLKSAQEPDFQEAARILEIYQKRLSFYFSVAHIRDKRKDFTLHKFADFGFMEKIVGDNYLAYDPLENRPDVYLATPAVVFDDDEPGEMEGLLGFFDHSPDDSPESTLMKTMIRSVYSSIPLPETQADTSLLNENQLKIQQAIVPADREGVTMFNVMENLATFTRNLFADNELYKQLRTTLDGSFNNGIVTLNAEVDFNEAFRDTTFSKTFLDLIKEHMRHPNKDEIPFYDLYLVAYQMLDSLGIDKDTITKKNSLVNILNDAMHSYFGLHCDIFVTDDKNNAKKTKALYQLFGAQTRVLTMAEFNKFIPEIIYPEKDTQDQLLGRVLHDLTYGERAEPFNGNGFVCQWIKEHHRYLDFFDGLVEVTGTTSRQIVIYKGYAHPLSDPSFSERAMIIKSALYAFGPDLENKGEFNYRDRNVRATDVGERKWLIDGMRVELSKSPLAEKYTLVLTLPELESQEEP